MTWGRPDSLSSKKAIHYKIGTHASIIADKVYRTERSGKVFDKRAVIASKVAGAKRWRRGLRKERRTVTAKQCLCLRHGSDARGLPGYKRTAQEECQGCRGKIFHEMIWKKTRMADKYDVNTATISNKKILLSITAT